MFKIKDLKWKSDEDEIYIFTPFESKISIKKDVFKKYYIQIKTSNEITIIDEKFETIGDAKEYTQAYITNEILKWIERI